MELGGDPQAIERIHVTEEVDRIRLEVEAGRALSYSLSTSAVPASVTVDLPGLVRGKDLGPLDINKPPVLSVQIEEMVKPQRGTQLVIALTEAVKPEARIQGTKLILEFPKTSSAAVGAGSDHAVGVPNESSEKNAGLEQLSTSRELPSSSLPSSVKSEGGGAAKTMTKVEVQRSDRDATVVIFGDGSFTYDVRPLRQDRLIVDLAHVTSELHLQVLPVDHPLLKQIRVGTHPDKTRLVFDLPQPALYSVQSQGNQLAVRLISLTRTQPPLGTSRSGETAQTDTKDLNLDVPVPGGSVQQVRGTEPGRVPFPERLAMLERTPRLGQMAPEAEPTTEAVIVGERRYVGRRISLDFQQADLTNVLRLIAEVSGFNIVVGEGVKNKVTIKLVSVPWDQALDMLLKMNSLGMIKEGNIVWIDTLSNIAKQQDEEARLKESKTKAEELVTKVIYVQNVQAQPLMTNLRQYLSPRGFINFNLQSNALIIKDTETSVANLKDIIRSLDIQVPQVHIEARIVQADTSYARSLGIQWGVVNSDVSSNGNFRVFGNLTGPFVEPKVNFDPTSGTTTFASNFMVNLPAAVSGLQSVPSAGFSLGKLAGGFGLDARLSAGELLGLTKVIAAPKITTLDNQEAKIEQGESIPFQTTSLQGTQTTFVDANLTLQVTPQITSRDPNEKNKRIILKIRTTRNAVGARSNPAGPSIDKREATTQVMLRDGETMVMGGIFVDTQTNQVAGVPYLSRIPVLGWLFKNKVESIAKQELLIFLTPSIVQS